MNSHTKQILIVAATILAGTLVVFVFLLNQVDKQGNKLAEYTTALSEKNAQEAAFIRVSRLVDETEAERATLSGAFFADESDSVSFLGEIETFASAIGLTLKTDGLDKITLPDSKQEAITMTFVYSGSHDEVMNFTRLLETIPYHSQVESLRINRDVSGSWEGNLTLIITIKPS
jgi:hypothetical protein